MQVSVYEIINKYFVNKNLLQRASFKRYCTSTVGSFLKKNENERMNESSFFNMKPKFTYVEHY